MIKVYSDLISTVNISQDTCGNLPSCTESHGSALRNMHLVCACRPLNGKSSDGGLEVELTSFQIVGISALMTSSFCFLLFLLKRCCSANIFLRYVSHLHLCSTPAELI